MQSKLGREIAKKFFPEWVFIRKRMMAYELIQTRHGFRAEMSLKITFFINVKLRIDRGFRRDANTDNVGSIIQVNFAE